MSTAQPLDQLVAEFARQIFPAARTLQVARVASGVSTWVYVIHLNDVRYYLRMLPEDDASFAPEVYVHAQLRAAGLRVPEVVYYEHDCELLARSVMVTTEIHGTPLALDAAPERMAAVLRDAGRELAVFNQVPVDGFGWIARNMPNDIKLCGESGTFLAWMHAEVEVAAPLLAACTWLLPSEVSLLARHIAAAVERFETDAATLAHGDFDAIHIFQSDGSYTGMIDFGEIRGTHQFYDLGHFSIEQAHFLAELLEGYREITALPPDYAIQIEQAALLVAVARTARRLARHRSELAADRQMILRALGKLPAV